VAESCQLEQFSSHHSSKRRVSRKETKVLFNNLENSAVVYHHPLYEQTRKEAWKSKDRSVWFVIAIAAISLFCSFVWGHMGKTYSATHEGAKYIYEGWDFVAVLWVFLFSLLMLPMKKLPSRQDFLFWKSPESSYFKGIWGRVSSVASDLLGIEPDDLFVRSRDGILARSNEILECLAVDIIVLENEVLQVQNQTLKTVCELHIEELRQEWARKYNRLLEEGLVWKSDNPRRKYFEAAVERLKRMHAR